MRYFFILSLVIGAMFAIASNESIAEGPAAGPHTPLPAEMMLAQQQRMAPQQGVQTLSPEMQTLLRRGDGRGARALAQRLGVSGRGGVQPYTCSESSCACAGVSDCINWPAP